MLANQVSAEKSDQRGNLTQRVIHGGAWLSGLRVVDRLIQITRIIIIARFLAPHDFGLFGIALVTMSALKSFSQTGFQAALIQKKKDPEDYLNAAWTLHVIRGIALASILYIVSPYVAGFFGETAARPLLQVFSLSLLIQGLTNSGIIYFERDLKFNKRFIYIISGTIADFMVSVLAVILLKNVWALVFGLLAREIVRLVASYLIHPYRPSFQFEWNKMRELYTFGRWILASSMISFLLIQGDDFFVGKLLGATALGFYQMAYRFANAIAVETTQVVSRVTFPAYSQIQDQLEKLKQGVSRSLQFTAFITFPIAGGIMFLASDFTRLILGVKWIPIIAPMQFLAFWGLLRSIEASILPLYKAIGHPDLETKLQISRLAILIILIYPLTKQWGILGTSLAIVVSGLITHFYTYFVLTKIINLDFQKLGKIFIIPVVSTLGSLMCVASIRFFLTKKVSVILFFSLIGVGILSYLAIIITADHMFNLHLWNTLKKQLYLHVKKEGTSEQGP